MPGPTEDALPTSSQTLNPFPNDVSLSPRMRRLVAQAVVDRRYGFTPASRYAPVFSLVEIVPGAKAEVEEIERYLDALDANTEDPVARFERLTGHVLRPETEGQTPATDLESRPDPGATDPKRLR